MGGSDHTEVKKPSVLVSLIPIASVLVLLVLSLTSEKFKMDIHIPLLAATLVASLISVFVLHMKWEDIEKGIIESITSAMQAILIACMIGMIIAAWIQGGIVPNLIYYGLKILSPKFFLVTCMIVCSILGTATGSSWTTAGTIGVAMIGIGVGMGIPAPVTAGSVVSGAYFGDKMSPFSDTTNLAPSMSGTTLFAHIRHMVYTTSVSYVLAVIGYMIVNLKFVSTSSIDGSVAAMSAALEQNFTISPWLLLPVLFLIILIVFKIPALPGLAASVFLGILCAIAFQGMDVAGVGNLLQYGAVTETGNAVLDQLLTGGGLQDMMWTVSLILCSLSFGGVMARSGMLEAISNGILKAARSTASLICATGFTAFLINLVCGEQYLSILLTGRMYREEYKKRNLAPQNLSRTLEDFGSISAPLIPWTTCAVAMSTYMGVATLDYLPWCFFNLINPLVAIGFAVTGATIYKRDQVDPRDLVD